MNTGYLQLVGTLLAHLQTHDIPKTAIRLAVLADAGSVSLCRHCARRPVAAVGWHITGACGVHEYQSSEQRSTRAESVLWSVYAIWDRERLDYRSLGINEIIHESHMDGLCNLLCLSRTQSLPERFG
jgi:hypothetical protein